MRFISAHVYRHLDLEETITVMPNSQKVIGNISEYMKRALLENTVQELIQEGSLVKVGQRKVSYEERKDFRKRIILKRCVVEMNMRGIGDFNNKPRTK